MRSVEACAANEWSLVLWTTGEGDGRAVVPFRCRSWRHEGACRQWCGACDFARVATAIGQHDAWTYLILTYPARKWPRVADLFRFGVVHWSRLRKRLITRYGPILYIQTWEVHKSGYPHVNVLISNANLHAEACQNAFEVKSQFVDVAAQEVGFGFAKYLKPMRNREAMAGYLTKLANELTGAHHKDQVPINAPPHFRRIRASRGLLPPRARNPNISGQMLPWPVKVVNERLQTKPYKGGDL